MYVCMYVCIFFPTREKKGKKGEIGKRWIYLSDSVRISGVRDN